MYLLLACIFGIGLTIREEQVLLFQVHVIGRLVGVRILTNERKRSSK